MISPAAMLAGAALAGAGAGFGTYRLLMVPDLVLRMRRRGASPAGLWAKAASAMWGPGYREAWREAGVNPALVVRAAAMFALPLLLLPVAVGLWWLGVVLGIASFAALPRMIARTALAARRRRIVAELPDALGPILESVRLMRSPVDGVRAGLPYTVPGGPLRAELEALLAETATHHDFPRALSEFARRVGHPLAQDLARILTVGFDRRLDPSAMESVLARLRGLRTQVVEEATKGVPSVMVGAVSLMFLAFCCLGAVGMYGMLRSQAGLLP